MEKTRQIATEHTKRIAKEGGFLYDVWKIQPVYKVKKRNAH